MVMRGNGAQSWNRTSDTAIFSRMLYQLSYLGAGRAGLEACVPVGGRGIIGAAGAVQSVEPALRKKLAFQPSSSCRLPGLPASASSRLAPGIT